MSTLAGLPYVELKFRKDGSRIGSGPVAPAGITDLIVISHGWHQAGRDAKAMYEALLTHVAAVAASHAATAGRTFGVAGVYWPSDKYKDDLTLETRPPDTGPAASLSDADIGEADLKASARSVGQLLGLKGLPLDAFAARAVMAKNGGADADALMTDLRGRLSKPSGEELSQEHKALLGSKKGSVLLHDMQAEAAAAQQGVSPSPALAGGGDPARPAVNLLTGAKALIARLLNQAAYYELKARAGHVGAGLAKVIDADGLAGVARLHLVGHSFGARLVTTTANQLQTVRPYSLTLLQAAFSHNSFGVDIGPNRILGGFRSVVADGKVAGRIVVSHTWNDTAVGVAYAIASAAAGQIANFLETSDTFGGPKDIHGGLGANGALRLKPGEGGHAEFDGAAVPTLATGQVSSRHCPFIPNHGGITGVETARLVVGAMS